MAGARLAGTCVTGRESLRCSDLGRGPERLRFLPRRLQPAFVVPSPPRLASPEVPRGTPCGGPRPAGSRPGQLAFANACGRPRTSGSCIA